MQARSFINISLLFCGICSLLSAMAGKADLTKTLPDSGDEIRFSVRTREYCLGSTEVFQATCMKNEVLVMNSAVYGRMRLNRCLQNEGDILLQAANNPQLRILGCSVDVLHIMDERCSGLGGCIVKGIDPEFHQISPCWSPLKNYLEVGYECVKVMEEDRSCSVSVTSSVQYLMSGRNSETKLSCGSRHQPWKLEAPAGQQINVSLLDFSRKDETSGCKLEGYILDTAENKNITLCNPLQIRKFIIYRSSSNVVSIVLTEQVPDDGYKKKLLIGLIAVGCSDVLAPADSWMRRMEDEAVVGCYTSRQTWRLRCVNNQWVGVIGNCTRETDEVLLREAGASANDFQGESLIRNPNEVVVIVVVVSLSMVICTVIICTASVGLRRYYTLTVLKQQSRGYASYREGTGKLLQGSQLVKEKSAPPPILIQT